MKILLTLIFCLLFQINSWALEIQCKVGNKRMPSDSYYNYDWRDGQIINIRPDGFYIREDGSINGEVTCKHFVVIQTPQDYWELTGAKNSKELKRGNSREDGVKQYTSAAHDGRYAWDDGDIEKEADENVRIRDWFIDFQFLLEQGLITQEQYDSIYDKTKKHLPIYIEMDLEDLVRNENLHARLVPPNRGIFAKGHMDPVISKMGTIDAGGTYTVGTAQTYADWSDAIADLPADIGAMTTPGDIILQGNTDEEISENATMTISLDTDIYTLTLNAASGVKHNGEAYGSGHRILFGSSVQLKIEEATHGETSNVVIQDLAFQLGSNASRIELGNGGDNGHIIVERCLLRGGTNTYFGISVGNYIDNVIVRNNIAYGFTSIYTTASGLYLYNRNYGNYVEIYNNTFCKNEAGMHIDWAGGTDNIAKNNICYGNLNGGVPNDYQLDDDFQTTSHNISGDATSPDAAYRNKVVTFVNEAVNDFHLSPTDISARDQGTDLSGEGFSDDIDADTRDVSGLGWDIGADETGSAIYRSVGPNKTTAVDDDSSAMDITISGSTASFTGPGGASIANNIGVGDVILYDSDNNNDLDGSDSIVFIHGRTDSQNFTVKEDDGAAPSTTTSANDKWAIYRAHTSLSNAEAGTENTTLSTMGFSYNGGDRNLVTNGEQWNIACYANGTTADTTDVYIQNWTTGSQNYIRLYTPTSISEVGVTQRHSGKWDATKYKMEVSNVNQAIRIYNKYVRIDGIQFKHTRGGSANEVRTIHRSVDNLDSDSQISNCIFWGDFSSMTGTSTARGICPSDSIGNSKIWNNIFYDYKSFDGLSRAVCACATSTSVGYLYNNTVYNCDVGFEIWGSTTKILKNNIVQNCTNGYYNTFDDSSDYNISNTSQQDADDVNNLFNGYLTVDFIDSTNYDFHLASFDTSAKDAGTSLVSDSYLAFNDDIDGQTRNPDGLGWDIGADEFIESLRLESIRMEGVRFE